MRRKKSFEVFRLIENTYWPINDCEAIVDVFWKTENYSAIDSEQDEGKLIEMNYKSHGWLGCK